MKEMENGAKEKLKDEKEREAYDEESLVTPLGGER